MKAARHYLASVSFPGGRRLPGPTTRKRAVAFGWAEGRAGQPRARAQVLLYLDARSAIADVRFTYDRRAGRWRRTDLRAARGLA